MTFSTDHPLVLDVSRHEGFMDIGKLANHNPLVYGVIARATISWGYRDSHYAYFKREVREKSKIRQDNGGLPLFFGGYHVIYPDQPVISQADNFFAAAGDDVAQDYPATIDVELDRGMPPAKISSSVGEMISVFFMRTGKVPVVYSRASWLNEHVTANGTAVPNWFNSVDFHLALYDGTGVEHAGPLYESTQWGVPKGLTNLNRLIMQQTSDTISGTEYGTPNYERVDTNRWQFSEEHLLDYIGYVKPIPLTLETLNERVKVLEREAKSHGWVLGS